MNRLVLLDVSGWIHRSYRACPRTTRSTDMLHTGAITGVASYLWKLIETEKFTHVAACYDASRRNWRHDIYPEYKSNRPKTEDELAQQIVWIKRLIHAFGINSASVDGFEADDLIATLARIGEESDMDVCIYSIDKDLKALISGRTSIFDGTTNKTWRSRDVVSKFGVQPCHISDLLALTGDASDHILGVPDIGPKTAAQLINMYGDVASILKNRSHVPMGKVKSRLNQFASQLELSRQLTALDANVPLNMDVESFRWTGPRGNLIGLLDSLELVSMLRKVRHKYGNELD